jgi:hypothetical protein
MGEMPPSGVYYGRPVNPAGRATRWTLLFGTVLAITVLVGIGVHRSRAEPTRAAAVPYAAKPVSTPHLVERSEPLQSLRPVRAVVVRKETRRPSPVVSRRSRQVVKVIRVSPKPRHTVQVKPVKKAASPFSALCARQFPHDLRLRRACVVYLSGR